MKLGSTITATVAIGGILAAALANKGTLDELLAEPRQIPAVADSIQELQTRPGNEILLTYKGITDCLGIERTLPEVYNSKNTRVYVGLPARVEQGRLMEQTIVLNMPVRILITPWEASSGYEECRDNLQR